MELYHTPSFLKRCGENPILSADRIPFPSVQVYNAGFTKFNGQYVMVFRNDYNRTEQDFRNETATPMRINLGLATSRDGIHWEVAPKPCFSIETEEIMQVYDPRLSVIDGVCYMCFAVNTRHGVRGGIARTDDFAKFEVLSMTSPDNRNMVLFPEKINGKFMRLERPFPVYSRSTPEAFDIWCSQSPDCRYWGDTALLLGAESVPYSNSKIGPGAPPIRTEKGWLATIHAVRKVEEELDAWHRNWKKEYYSGLMLLDLEDPTRVIGLSREPLIVPETDYERHGMRGSVVFPGGMILEDSGEVKIYYGAADTVECLATADVNDLLNFCQPPV